MSGVTRGRCAQSSHRLEKYLDTQDCLEKSLKIKFALKSTWKTLKGLEKSLLLEFLPLQEDSTLFIGCLNQYKIVVPLSGAAYAPNKGTIIFTLVFKN